VWTIQRVSVQSSLNHFVRSRQHIRRNCQTDLFRGFQIEHQLELRWLLHRKIGRFGPFEDFVHEDGNAPAGFGLGRVRRTSSHRFRPNLPDCISPPYEDDLQEVPKNSVTTYHLSHGRSAAHNETDHKKNQKNYEQNPRDLGRGASDAAEPKNPGNQSDDKKSNAPT
jgi:hypothetical protein